MSEFWHIRISGLVQGVGFRPHVWRLASELGLSGSVLNDGEGVLIEIACSPDVINEFVRQIKETAPPLSRIDDIQVRPLDQAGQVWDGFEIVPSEKSDVKTGVVPDAATCSDCLNDVSDIHNRRYRYPFTNCTHCGPRFSIIKGLPYDRAQTTMAAFPMCATCRDEYNNPKDRRFHAQPNACPDCGPRVWMEDQEGETLSKGHDSDALAQAACLLKAGHILAIKGVGGFHLVCDALNEEAVQRLRQRKRRPAKPLALMARDTAMVSKFATLNAAEKTALKDRAAPVVLLQKAQGQDVAPSVAPGSDILGFMLPYTPLHHILFQDVEAPLVMTSANLSHEPQVIDNQEAREKLPGIADYFVMHDRDIENRIDDSVVRYAVGGLQMMRRARGFAPASHPLPPSFDGDVPILAVGPDLKNTFALCQQDAVVVSQHMGDQDNLLAHEDYRKNIDLYETLFDMTPGLLVHDLHPDYRPTRWAHQVAASRDIPVVGVQHHHAHIAAVMMEHGMAKDHPPVLGVVLDGLGLSEGGEIWGGEFLHADYQGFTCLAHFPPVALIGGDRAMKEPWRNLYAHLVAALGWTSVEKVYGNLAIVERLKGKNLRICDQMMAKGINVPATSSAGRLFDAVAAALGICFDQITFEGEAAIALEQMAQHAPDVQEIYDNLTLDTWAGIWQGLLADLNTNVEPEVIARKFHNTLTDVICQQVVEITKQHDIEDVILSGGVFQNKLLLEQTVHRLKKSGKAVYWPTSFPANDGGLSLGQVGLAAARL